MNEDENKNPVQEPEPVEVPAAQETPQAEPAKTTPSRDYDAELAAKDLEIRKITTDWQTAKNTAHLTQEENTKAQVALAKAVQERERLVAEKDAKLAKAQEELEMVSQATQTLSKERTDLSNELETADARATKYQILAEEFPDLLRYSKLIPASRDAAVVRAACTDLMEARGKDLEAQRIGAVTNPLTSLPTQPLRTDPAIETTDQAHNYLRQAMSDPKEYERRRQLLLERYNAAVAAAASR